VLIVDDNIDSAETLARLATSWGHEVQLAHDGTAAIEMAKSFRPQVVLLDIGLPLMNGYDVASHLRQLPDFAQTLLVAMTGYGQAEDRRRAEKAGFNRHLVKPVPADVLEELLKTLDGTDAVAK
jgi:CheY-like chemotaxis protein